MLQKVCGIVVKVQKLSSGGKLVWILTKDQGLIKAFCREPGRRAGGFVATGFLTLSDFVLYGSRSGFTINTAEAKEPFANICKDVERLALASYFCEVVVFAMPQQYDSAPALKLLYLVLLALNSGAETLKAKVIFELKFVGLLGFLPKLSSEEVKGAGRFCVKTGSLAAQTEIYSIKVSAKIAETLKAIVNLAVKRGFMLKISQAEQKKLAVVAEAYLQDKLEAEFKTLDYFWNLNRMDFKLDGVGGKA